MYQFFSFNGLKYYGIVLLLAACAVNIQAQTRRIDSLKAALTSADKNGRFTIQFDLFRELMDSDPNQSLFYAESALDQALSNRDSLNIVRASNGRGWILKNQGDLSNSIKAFQFALGIAKRNHYQDQVKYILNNLALSYTLSASFDKALEYHFESLKIRESEGNPVEISVALNNIGYLYHELADYENATVYYEKSYEVKVKNKVSYDLERVVINLGLVYNELGRFERAEKKLKEAFAICDSTDCKPDILVEANQALGVARLGLKDMDGAEQAFNKSLRLANKIDLSEFVAADYYWLAKLRYEQKRMDEAIDFLESSLEVSVKTNFRKTTLNNYMLYSRIYSDKGDYREASHYQDLYIKLYGEIFNADLIKNISRVTTAYQEQQNIRTIAEKDEILELNRERISQQRLLNWLLIAIIILTSALGIVIYRNYQKVKSVNDALASAKKMIEVQNQLLDNQVQEKTKELVDTNEQLVKVNDELDNFIYKTSHDIRGPLASLKGMVNLAIMDVKDEKAQGYLGKLDITAEKLNTVLTRLLIVNRINHAELKPESIHFEPIIQEILTLEVKKGVPAKIRIEYEVAPDIQLISDKEMVRLILENLIDNALKFYNESERVESFVKIFIRMENGHVTARVMDNGTGISQMNQEKIFQMFVRASERSETGGIGLYLAKLATEKLGGDINLMSTNERHTEFIVTFPSDLHAIIEQRRTEKYRLDGERLTVEKKQGESGRFSKTA